MIGTKYLSEAVHAEEIRPNTLNLVKAPVGSGKTTWALDVLSKTVSAPHKMIYLIDTRNGKEQLLKRPDTQYYSRDWQEVVNHGEVWFGEAAAANRVVVMTYAKFGVLAERYPSFGYSFELMIGDEIHNLPRFSSFINGNPNDKPYHKIAKRRLEEIIQHSDKTRVIGLSATPRRAAEQMKCEVQYITVDHDVRRLEEKETIRYTNIDYLLNSLSPKDIGLVYISHVEKMKAFAAEAKKKGFSPIAIWSDNNKSHPMNDEQKKAREYIIENAALPPEYNMVIINASSETSINIYGKVDYIIIHTQEEEPQVQARGRYREDLRWLYLLDYDTAPIVPPEYMNRKLFSEDKKELCEILSLRNENGNKMGWITAKRKLEEAGYCIKEGRENSRRYHIITF